MKIKNINRTIYKNGDTSDIIKVVMMAYDIENDPQIQVVATELKGNTIVDTCRNIWKYLQQNITYRADSGMQEIKSPARLIHDKSGDCKSYALFTAVILRWLGIKNVFRFVSYDNNAEATHVYIVAFNEENQPVIIDAVAAVQLNAEFNTEIKYTYHCDMANSGTKIAYLAGYNSVNRNQKIGSAFDMSRYKVWTGDESEHTITPGKQYLYSEFDLNSELLNVAASNRDKINYLNKLDILAALLYAYNYVAGDTRQYRLIAQIICGLITKKRFMNNSLDVNDRADYFNTLLDTIIELYHTNQIPELIDQSTWNLLENNVFNHNEPAITGIGSFWPWDIIADKIKASGLYFIYTYIPDNDLANYPAIVAKKRASQKQVKDWMVIDVFHTAATRENLIRSGIIAQTGKTPEEFLADTKKENIHQIGGLMEVLTIISTILAIVIGLITLIRSIWPPKNSPTNDDIMHSGADLQNEVFSVQQNYGKSSGTGTKATSNTSKLILPVVAAGSALFLFTRIKK